MLTNIFYSLLHFCAYFNNYFLNLGCSKVCYQRTEFEKKMTIEFSSEHKKNRRQYDIILKGCRDFPGGAVVENLPANAGDTGSSPGLGRSHMPRSN